MEQRRLRLGLIGCGRRGRQHLSTIAALPDVFELVAVCDMAEAAAVAAAQGTDARTHTRVSDFFDSERLDAVVIVTNPDTHHLIAKAAALRGVHMLIETPLAPTRAMMDFILDVTAKAGVQAEVGEQFWRRPAERLNRRALDAGLIGTVSRVTAWYEAIGQLGAYHHMSLLRHYAGADVTSVRAFSHQYELQPSAYFGRSTSSEMWTQAILTYANGVTGSCTFLSSWVAASRQGLPSFFSVEGTEGFIVSGSGASHLLHRVADGVPLDFPLRIDGDDAHPLRYYYETDPLTEYINPFADRTLLEPTSAGLEDALSRADELMSLYRAVTSGAPPEYGLAKARRDQELNIAIHEAARTGQEISAMPGAETAWEGAQHVMFRSKWDADPFDGADALLQRM